jgi:hypothetical protein
MVGTLPLIPVIHNLPQPDLRLACRQMGCEWRKVGLLAHCAWMKSFLKAVETNQGF